MRVALDSLIISSVILVFFVAMVIIARTLNRNMTARMRVESQGDAMLEALRESEERYRELVERSPQGIIVRQDDKYILANQSFADLVGYSTDELLGFTTDEIYALVSPDDQEMIAQR